MSFILDSRRLIAYSFTLSMAFSFPLAAVAQENSNPLCSIFPGISNERSDSALIARGGGGGRGGGGSRGGARGGGGGLSRGGGGGGNFARASGARGGGSGFARVSGGSGQFAARSHSSPLSGGRSGGISRAGSSKLGQHDAQRPQSGAERPQAFQSAVRQGQQPSALNQPVQRPTNPAMNAGRAGQLPTQRPINGQRAGNLPNRSPSQINASRSVNVEGYDGGWGYSGQGYPWGLGAARGVAGFMLGSMLNTLPTNSQPVVIQGQSYYESDGMYLEPSDNGKYTVVPPPAGAIETQLPNGAKPVDMKGNTLYEVQGVYYQKTLHDGQPAYMVVTP